MLRVLGEQSAIVVDCVKVQNISQGDVLKMEIQTQTSNIPGTSRPTRHVDVKVTAAKERIKYVAAIAAKVVLQQNPGLGVSFDDLKSFNEVSLEALVKKSIDPEAKVEKGIKFPCYFDILGKGLITKIGRSEINSLLGPGEDSKVPSCYRNVYTSLVIAGIKCVNPHPPVERESQTLNLFLDTIDDVELICGNLTDINLEEIILRALLKVSDEDQAVLKSMAGELRFQYGELDDLILRYVTDNVKVAVK